MSDQIKRQVAFKCSILDLIDGTYVKEEGWTPNYVKTKDGRIISRVNVIATILSKPDGELNYKGFLIDDGSAKIDVRSFDENFSFDGMDIGDAVLIIGRPREFGDQKYIIPEIIKKVDNRQWIKVRMMELNKNKKAIGNTADMIKDEAPKDFSESVDTEEIEETSTNERRALLSLIRKHDQGNGVEIDKITKQLNSSNAEKIISGLLKDGEIFEISPGRVRILE